MKHLFKKILIVFALILVSFLYFSCTQEKEFINDKNHPKFDIQQKSFKEALAMPVFNTAYSKLAKKSIDSRAIESARTVLEDQFGFTIVTEEPVRIITKEDGTILYTILIEREIKEELKFENLMIQVKNDETSAAIFKYLMAEKAVKTVTNDYAIKDIVSSEFTDLNIEGRMFFNSEGQTCFDTFVFKCDAELGYTHNAFDWCFANGTAYAVIGTTCMNDGTGPANSGTGPTSENPPVGGFNASSGFSDDPVETIILPCKQTIVLKMLLTHVILSQI